MLHTLTTIWAATSADADVLARLAESSQVRRLHGRARIADADQGVIAAIEVASGTGGGAQVRSLFRREAARLAA